MSVEVLPTRVEAPGSGGGRPEPATATLLFRVGVVDTEVRSHGQLHVLAALARRTIADQEVDHDLTVGPVTTRVSLTGETDQVVQALRRLAAWWQDPTWSDLDRVVAEVRRRDDGVDGPLRLAAAQRWGDHGLGLLGADLDVRGATDPEALHGWCTSHFTAGNAVLSGNRPELDGLELALPPGPRMPVPTGSAPPHALPALVTVSQDELLPGAAPVTTALTRDAASTRVLSALLTRELSAQAAGSEEPGRTRTRAVPVGSRLLWLYEHDRASPAQQSRALERLARGDVAKEAVSTVAAHLAAAPPPTAAVRAERAALADLLGQPAPRALTEVIRDEVVAEAQEAVQSLLVLAGQPDSGTSELTVVPPPAPRRRRRDFGGPALLLTIGLVLVVALVWGLSLVRG